MPRRALIVQGAAGPDTTATDLLQLRDFTRAVTAASVDDALGKMQHEHFDLVLVPLAAMQPSELQALDRTVRRAVSTFVVGTAAEADPALLLRGFRAGMHEFLQLPLKADEFLSAIDRLIQRMQFGGSEGTVVAVYSAKGGVGTTTIAVNLAHALALGRPDGGVTLGDLVSGSGDVRVHLNISPTYHRGDLLQKLDRIDSELFRSVLTESADGLWVLPGPDVTELNGTLDGLATNAIITQMRQDFAFAVLDCEHHLGDSTIAALMAADHVLVVADLSLATIRSTQRALLLARRLGLADEKLHVVINRNQSGDILSAIDAQQAFKREIFWKLPNDYRTAAGALAKGIPVTRYDARSKLAVSFHQLAEKLGVSATSASHNGTGPRRHSRMAQLFSRAQKRS